MTPATLEPGECFARFAELCAIPHCSYNETAIGDYLVSFAAERGLACSRDRHGNVLIKKTASKGMEKAPGVILQGHMDMVCVKKDGVAHDFTRDPIQLRVEDGWLKAQGTTLGADNGIGLAMILALLDAGGIAHPALEAVITVAEEVGMMGAEGFDAAQLSGRYFINTDSEEEGVFCVSCAGGRRSELSLPVKREPGAPLPGNWYTIILSGLAGGHSGLEIIKERGNANKLMGRVLARLDAGPNVGAQGGYDVSLRAIEGGSADNVIAFECRADIRINADETTLARELAALQDEFRAELKAADGAGLDLRAVPAKAAESVLDRDSFGKVLALLLLLPNGVLSMDLNVLPLRQVESSANVGIVSTREDAVVFTTLVRASVNSRKFAVCRSLEALAALTGAASAYSGDYPAWEYKPDSRLSGIFHDAYTDLFGSEPKMEGIHAGLECGLFFDKFRALGKDVDFISFGPDITGAHTPEEAVRAASVANVWKLLQAVLGRIRE